MAIRNEAKNALEYSGHKKCSCKRGKRWQLNCLRNQYSTKQATSCINQLNAYSSKIPNEIDVFLH